jgi:hypothetical protein
MQGHDHWACVLQTSHSLAKLKHFMWTFQSQNIPQLHYKVPICHFKNVHNHNKSIKYTCFWHPKIKAHNINVYEVNEGKTKFSLIFLATLSSRPLLKTHLHGKFKQEFCLKTNLLENEASANDNDASSLIINNTRSSSHYF